MEYIIRFDLKEGKARAFVQWLKDNREAFESSSPEGWSYGGTFFVVRSFGDYTCETRWNLSHYGAMDATNPPGFEHLVDEWTDFAATNSVRAALLKGVDEVIMMGSG